MPQAVPGNLVGFLRDRAGEHLRGVVRYDRDSHELLYRRRDVGRAFSDDDLARVVDDLRRGSADPHRLDGMNARGELCCTVRVFDAAVELHFPHAPDAGTVVALEPKAATRLRAFVDDCIDNLAAERPGA